MAILPLQLARVSNLLRSNIASNSISRTQKNLLNVQNELTTGQRLVSPNKMYLAVMQADGNLCVKQGPNPKDSIAMWCAMDQAQTLTGHYYATMQGDGNLCIYPGRPDDPPAKKSKA